MTVDAEAARRKGGREGEACRKAGDVNNSQTNQTKQQSRFFCYWAGMGSFDSGGSSYMGR